MAAVCAAGYAGQLAAHVVPAQMGSIQRGLSRLPKAVPKFVADWQAGIPRAKMIVDRLERDGPQGPPYVADFGFAHRGDEDIWVDKELTTLMSRKDFTEYMRWREDLQSVGRMVMPFFYFGPLGLVSLASQLRAEHELPSQLVETDEDRVRQRLNRDLLRLRHAPATRAALYFNLVQGAEGSSHALPTYTETEHDDLMELFDMDLHTLRDMSIWHKYIPLLGKKYGGMHQTVCSHAFLRQICSFWNLPWRTLMHGGRQKAVVEHFRVLRNDDEFIRQGGGASELSDEELFVACHTRAIVRQEETDITRANMENRLTIWLNLGDASYWKKHGYGPFAPSPFWQTLLAANVYCDPAYDPQLDLQVVERMTETPGVTKTAVQRDLAGSYEKHMDHMTSQVQKEAMAAYEQSELQRVEREASALRSMDKLVTTLQSVGVEETSTESVEEHVVTEKHSDASTKMSPMHARCLMASAEMPKVRPLTPEERKQVELRYQFSVAQGVRRNQFDIIQEEFPEFLVPLEKLDPAVAANKEDVKQAV
eukprot:TRINITY_DN44794_c0_g1_i1.p1 TRINITY_DN44794_c0_g1~~TRINITY_DN44794_c0_g1_i1.p1  ORF type:complete len:536 (-),score=162.36 TRINITY_DN44794_c0_g1_i1:337-1944(-)